MHKCAKKQGAHMRGFALVRGLAARTGCPKYKIGPMDR